MILLRLLLAVLLLGGRARGSELLRAVHAETRQLVLVTTAGWGASEATLQRFARADLAAPWRSAGPPMAAQVGENGLAWGRGLHRIPRTSTARRKREGDRRAPAGVFLLSGAFGQLAARAIAPLRLPYQQVGAGWEAVDDPASRFYNRIVNRAVTSRPDWRSSERLDRGTHYRLAVMVAHNPDAVPGAGSCIFLHERVGRRKGTAGCTVLRREDLQTLVRWLDAHARPVLVQVPRTEAPRW